MPRLVTRSARPINVEILLRNKIISFEGDDSGRWRKTKAGKGSSVGDYGTELMPGLEKGTVAYHTEDRKIFHTLACTGGRKTIGL